MQDIIDKVKLLKNQYIEAGKRIAGYESTLEMLKKQECELIKKCVDLGVDPDGIDARILQLTDSYNKLVTQIDSILNPRKEVDTSELNSLLDDLNIQDDIFFNDEDEI